MHASMRSHAHDQSTDPSCDPQTAGQSIARHKTSPVRERQLLEPCVLPVNGDDLALPVCGGKGRRLRHACLYAWVHVCVIVKPCTYAIVKPCTYACINTSTCLHTLTSIHPCMRACVRTCGGKGRSARPAPPDPPSPPRCSAHEGAKMWVGQRGEVVREMVCGLLEHAPP